MAQSVEVVGRAELDSTQIQELARDLNQICRSATLDLVFQVGQLIITRLFGRDLRLWPTAECTPSYRALAACGNLMLSPSALCRAVSTYVLVERLGGRARWRHLSASHFQEVLPLAPALQEAWLSAAEEGRWTVARLREACAPNRRRRRSGTVSIVRSLEKLGSRLAEHNAELGQAPGNELAREAVDELTGAIDAVSRELLELRERVEQRARRRNGGR